jgi:hypothetical protein
VDTIKNNLRHIKSEDFISDIEEVENPERLLKNPSRLRAGLLREAAGSASHE